jgi:hypothetical protein
MSNKPTFNSHGCDRNAAKASIQFLKCAVSKVGLEVETVRAYLRDQKTEEKAQ